MNLKEIINVIEERRTSLLKMIADLEKKHYDEEGELAIRVIRRNEYLYRRVREEKGNGEYLGKNKTDIAAKLADKDRNRKMIVAAKEEIRNLEEVQRILLNSTCTDDVYESLPEIQRSLIRDSGIDLEYARKWESVSYYGNPQPITNPCTTLKGIVVRSKSEGHIADRLFLEGIPFRYEFPFTVQGYTTIYPDFTILNVRTKEVIIWEHLGKMDDPDYCERALYKLEFYYEHGYVLGKNLIITMESSRKPFDPGFWVSRLMKDFLV